MDFLLKKTASFLGCKTMMRKIFLSFFLLVITHCSIAQDNGVASPFIDTSFTIGEDDESEIEEDSDFAKDVLGDTSVNFNDFLISKDSVAALKLKKDYGWIKNIDSFLLAQKKEDGKQAKIIIKQNSGDSFLSKLFNSGILKVIMWVIAAAVVLFIIYKLFLSEAVFGRRNVKTGINLQNDEEDEDLVNDYDQLLRKAYGEGNWRFAMRFLFLKTLQKLNEKELIKYAVDKTNSAYVMELPSAKKNDFASLALYYEYVWYGKAEIGKDIFDAIENKYNNFLNKI